MHELHGPCAPTQGKENLSRHPLQSNAQRRTTKLAAAGKTSFTAIVSKNIQNPHKSNIAMATNNENKASSPQVQEGGQKQEQPEPLFQNPPIGHRLLTNGFSTLEELKDELHFFTYTQRFNVTQLRHERYKEGFGPTVVHFFCSNGLHLYRKPKQAPPPRPPSSQQVAAGTDQSPESTAPAPVLAPAPEPKRCCP